MTLDVGYFHHLIFVEPLKLVKDKKSKHLRSDIMTGNLLGLETVLVESDYYILGT